MQPIHLVFVSGPARLEVCYDLPPSWLHTNLSLYSVHCMFVRTMSTGSNTRSTWTSLYSTCAVGIPPLLAELRSIGQYVLCAYIRCIGPISWNSLGRTHGSQLVTCNGMISCILHAISKVRMADWKKKSPTGSLTIIFCSTLNYIYTSFCYWAWDTKRKHGMILMSQLNTAFPDKSSPLDSWYTGGTLQNKLLQ